MDLNDWKESTYEDLILYNVTFSINLGVIINDIKPFYSNSLKKQKKYLEKVNNFELQRELKSSYLKYRIAEPIGDWQRADSFEIAQSLKNIFDLSSDNLYSDINNKRDIIEGLLKNKAKKYADFMVLKNHIKYSKYHYNHTSTLKGSSSILVKGRFLF